MVQRKLTPRLFTKTEAAHYCGLNTHTFTATCPVRPIGLGVKGDVMRYDVQALDAWIERMGKAATDEVDPMALLEALGSKRRPSKAKRCRHPLLEDETPPAGMLHELDLEGI